MFAKKARSLNYSRGPGLRRNAAAVRPCNDNRPVRLIAPRRRKRRPLLFCRWQLTPAGQLECSWHDGSAPAAEEPWIGWSGAALHRSNRGGDCAASQPTWPENYTVQAINAERLDRLCAPFFNQRRSGAPVGLIGQKGIRPRLVFWVESGAAPATVSGELYSERATGLCGAKSGKADDGDDPRARRPA
jgi:hypothetical protein